MKALLVVSDALSNFAGKPGVTTYSKLMQLLSGPSHGLDGTLLVAGQGLSDMEIDHAYCVALSVGLTSELKAWRHLLRTKRATSALTHKARPENILISRPQATGRGRYIADLLIDSRSELMLDHATGQHIQGMVLIEAARQMFIATTEQHLLADYGRADRYFVINEMNTTFSQFVFPVACEVALSLVEWNESRPGRRTFLTDIEFTQTGRSVASVRVKYSVFPKLTLLEKEEKLAEAAFSSLLELISEHVEAACVPHENVAADMAPSAPSAASVASVE